MKAGVIGSFAGEPLVHGGHVIGAVSIFDETPRHFTAREHQSLRTQARVAASVIAERAATAVDQLTGLATRTAMLDLAGQALAQRRSGGSSTTQTALMVLDVVDMAGVNRASSAGRRARDVARRLRVDPADKTRRSGDLADERARRLPAHDRRSAQRGWSAHQYGHTLERCVGGQCGAVRFTGSHAVTRSEQLPPASIAARRSRAPASSPRPVSERSYPAVDVVEDHDALAAVLAATRALLTAARPEQVAGILKTLVHDLGGGLVPARLADGNGLPMDVALGFGEPLLPWAEPVSVAAVTRGARKKRPPASRRLPVPLSGYAAARQP